MHELVESIMLNGVLTPVIVRKIENGEYEMISGHRRLFAIKQIGFDTIPAIIKNYSDIRNNLCSRSCNLADVGSYSFLDRYLERIVGKM